MFASIRKFFCVEWAFALYNKNHQRVARLTRARTEEITRLLCSNECGHWEGSLFLVTEGVTIKHQGAALLELSRGDYVTRII